MNILYIIITISIMIFLIALGIYVRCDEKTAEQDKATVFLFFSSVPMIVIMILSVILMIKK